MPASPTGAVLAALDADRAAPWAAVASVPVSLRDRRPAADAWSVADVLDHLRPGPPTGEAWVLALGGHEARHAAQTGT